VCLTHVSLNRFGVTNKRLVEGTTSARQVRAMKLGQINVVVYRVDIIGRMRERPRLVSSLATPLTISGKDAAKRCLSLKTG